VHKVNSYKRWVRKKQPSDKITSCCGKQELHESSGLEHAQSQGQGKEVNRKCTGLSASEKQQPT
jgi:hypothetical protein